jgi:predicted amidohydrolase
VAGARGLRVAKYDQIFDFPNVLSKFLLIGMPLDQVIAMGTANAARVVPGFKDLGTLRVGGKRI